MGAVGRYLRNDADLFGRRLLLRQPGLARSQFGGVPSRVGDCVPHGGILRRVPVSRLPPVHFDHGDRLLALGNPTFYCFWLRSSRQSRRKLDGRCDGGSVWFIPLVYVTTNWQLVVCCRTARQFCLRRDFHLLGSEQRVSLLRTPAQLCASGSTMVDGRCSRPGSQHDDVCRARPHVRAVRAVRPACSKSTDRSSVIPAVSASWILAIPADDELCRFSMRQRVPLLRHIANPCPAKCSLGVSKE